MDIMNDLESIKKGYWAYGPRDGTKIERWDVEDKLVPQTVKNYEGQFGINDIYETIKENVPRRVDGEPIFIEKKWVRAGLRKLENAGIIIPVKGKGKATVIYKKRWDK